MHTEALSARQLTPLAYHLELADFLMRQEPDVWRWEAAKDQPPHSHSEQAQAQRDALRIELLRDSYRIPSDSHPAIHACLQRAMQNLGIQVPANLYQSSALESNASLVFVPGEVHIILHGRLLEQMSEEELTAIFGHELAHYVLWTCEGGKFHVVERILRGALESDYQQPQVRESYRRYLLHTELFADRGSAMAVGAVEPAVAALVKAHTGINHVDAKAYLQQAEEIAQVAQEKSEAYTHPEAYLRARALMQWWEGHDGADQWIREQLQGRIELEALDFLQQQELQVMVRRYLSGFLHGTAFVSDAVTAQLRHLFPDWRANEPMMDCQAILDCKIDRGVKRLLNALMMDLCLADPDQQDAMLHHALQHAIRLESLDDLIVNLRRDVGLNKREIDKLSKKAQAEVNSSTKSGVRA